MAGEPYGTLVPVTGSDNCFAFRQIAGECTCMTHGPPVGRIQHAVCDAPTTRCAPVACTSKRSGPSDRYAPPVPDPGSHCPPSGLR
jgi:hypothetical protein